MNKLLKDINSDIELSSNIIVSDKYTENVTISNVSDYTYFTNLVHCIIDNNDLQASVKKDNIYLQQKIIEICNDITPELLSTYNFNKTLKPIKFQQGLQISDTKHSYSSLSFLREFYKTNFIIIHNDIAYDDTIKKYPVQYIVYKNDKFRILDNIDNVKTIYSLCEIFEKDIKGNLYNTILKNITTYKLPELVKLAEEYKISSNGKKKDLYDRLYKTFVNL